jgi:hypothetical protein
VFRHSLEALWDRWKQRSISSEEKRRNYILRFPMEGLWIGRNKGAKSSNPRWRGLGTVWKQRGRVLTFTMGGFDGKIRQTRSVSQSSDFGTAKNGGGCGNKGGHAHLIPNNVRAELWPPDFCAKPPTYGQALPYYTDFHRIGRHCLFRTTSTQTVSRLALLDPARTNGLTCFIGPPSKEMVAQSTNTPCAQKWSDVALLDNFHTNGSDIA